MTVPGRLFIIIRGNQQLILGSLGVFVILPLVGIKNDEPFIILGTSYLLTKGHLKLVALSDTLSCKS